MADKEQSIADVGPEIRNLGTQLNQMVQSMAKMNRQMGKVGDTMTDIGRSLANSQKEMISANRDMISVQRSHYSTLVNSTKAAQQMNQTLQKLGNRMGFFREVLSVFFGIIGAEGIGSVKTFNMVLKDVQKNFGDSGKSLKIYKDIFKDFFTSLSKIGSLGGFKSYARAFEKGNEFLKKFNEKDKAGDIFGDWWLHIKSLIQKNKQGIGQWNGIQKEMKSAINAFASLPGVLKTKFQWGFSGLTTTITELSKALFQNTKKTFSGLGGVILSSFKLITNPIKNFLINMSKGYDIGKGMSSVTNATTKGLPKTQKAIEELSDSLKNMGINIPKIGGKGIPPVLGEGGGGIGGGIGKFLGGAEEGGIMGGGAALGLSAAATAGIALAIVGIIALVTKLFLVFKQIDATASNWRISMGFLNKYASNLVFAGTNAASQYAKFGGTLEDALDATTSITETMGTALYTTTGMVASMILFNKQLGVSYKTSSDFLLNMGMISRSTADASQELLTTAGQLSQQSFTNLSTVMEDVNESMKSSYSYMSKSPVVLIKSAIEARKLGTSLQSIVQTQRSLLNFTTSVQDEMEASVLVGKSINLQHARELSYRRDTLGLNEEILKIAQDTNFENLDPFQQEAVAKALGKTTGELGKMLQMRREMVKSGKSLIEIQKQEYAEQLKTKANQSALNQVSNAFSQIWVDLAPTMLIIADIIKSLIPIVRVVAQMFAESFRGIKLVTDVAGLIMGKNPFSTNAFGEIKSNVVTPPAPADNYKNYSMNFDKINSKQNVKDTTSEEHGKKLDKLADSIDAMHDTLKKKDTNVYLDSQRVDAQMGRRLAYTGPLTG